MKKYFLLIIIFFVLLAFVFITYFYWTPDSIAPLVSEKTLFYLHLNLNGLTREGRENAGWLRECLSRDGLEIPMLSKEMVSLVDEIGWIGLAEEDGIELALVLKPKTWRKDLPPGGEKRLVRKKINSRFFVMAESDEILSETGGQKLWKEPELSRRRGLTGYINIRELALLAKINPPPFGDAFFKYLALSLKGGGPKEKDLCFELRAPDSRQKIQDLGLIWLDFLPWVGEKFVLILTSSEEINLDIIEKQFKIDLALEKPVEREVTLPDGSKFTEFLVDPDQFYFEEADKSFRYLIERDLGFEIALGKDSDYIFISNSLDLLEKTISNGFWDKYLLDDFSQALYWPIERFGLKELIAFEKEGRIEGCLAPY